MLQIKFVQILKTYHYAKTVLLKSEYKSWKSKSICRVKWDLKEKKMREKGCQGLCKKNSTQYIKYTKIITGYGKCAAKTCGAGNLWQRSICKFRKTLILISNHP